ncbi:uroporphyrinogen III methyltransferase [Jannaschia pagri]|uniref:Uroporphyrinogen III methyltransferase n=1 Tax=Jannaschia pagri TaxID=2829797 RepID=A0ABQ4NRT0_9RHOB|nr:MULTISPECIES: uroporphyrinogen-III synthase [unclassified Jannaschia]GIT92957.1 uroporphyrinogen III methyltransferase [Jannaschia sp. AI_61]GIT96792.1 uroporphyrinogen III methyltransferase [Jannaschia sp. AI_62]
MLPEGAPPVLLTRPAAASERLAQWLRGKGAQVIVSPLLAIRYASHLPEVPGALVFTSTHGVAAYRALGGAGGLPTWCVGPRTAASARQAGLAVQGVAPTAAALAKDIPDGAPALLHLRGAVQRGDFAADLRARGLIADSAVLYHQDPLPLSPAAKAALSAPIVVPLYSPRTATLFAQACPPEAWPHVQAIGLSQAVVDPLPISAPIARRPDGSAMRDAIMVVLGGSAVEGQPRSL